MSFGPLLAILGPTSKFGQARNKGLCVGVLSRWGPPAWTQIPRAATPEHGGNEINEIVLTRCLRTSDLLRQLGATSTQAVGWSSCRPSESGACSGEQDAHTGNRTPVTSMEGLYDATTLCVRWKHSSHEAQQLCRPVASILQEFPYVFEKYFWMV